MGVWEFGIAGEPAVDIELVRALVSEIAVAVVKLPMPVVMELGAHDGRDFARSAPKIIIHIAGSYLGFGHFADGWAGFVAETTCDFHFADGARLDEVISLMPCAFRATLEAVLDDRFVFYCGVGELAPFPDVV